MGGGGSKPDPGCTDARHFRTERVIGQGGFGKVNCLTKSKFVGRVHWMGVAA